MSTPMASNELPDDESIQRFNKLCIKRFADREYRAFNRTFWWFGVCATVLTIVVIDSMIGLNKLVAIQSGSSFRPADIVVIFAAHLVAIPAGILVFGSGPAFLMMFWINVFPESKIGDKELFGPRDPFPQPPGEASTTRESGNA